MNVRAARFPLFDSLRAVAVLCVLAYHALGFAAAPGSDYALRPYVANLSVGVSIFFVISGFLLYRPIARAHLRGEPWLPIRVYAWRRFLRIVPAYWVALLVVALWLGTPGILSVEGIAQYWLFGQVYSADSALGGLPQAWSLDVEVGFYALLPLVALALARLSQGDPAARLRRQWALLALLFVAGLVFNVLVLEHAGPARYATWLHTLPAFLDTFPLGMALALISVAGEDRLPGRAVRLVDRAPGLAWAAAVALFVLVSLALDDRGGSQPLSDGEFLARRLGFALIATAVILPGVFGDHERGLVRRFLAWRPLLWIGLISYSLFIYHVAVIEQLRRWDLGPAGSLHPYLAVLDALVPSLAIAAISYYVIERPALRFKRLLGPRVEPQPSESTAEPAPVAAAR